MDYFIGYRDAWRVLAQYGLEGALVYIQGAERTNYTVGFNRGLMAAL